jgi:Big-like domain-containing protein
MSTALIRLLLVAGLLCCGCNSPTAPTTTGLTVNGAPNGNNVQAVATAQMSDGSTQNVSVGGATWSSSDTQRATVSATGFVTPGPNTGDVDIRATYQGFSATLRLVVEPGRVRKP